MDTVKKTKNSNIDFFKFICAFGVICIHTQNSTSSAFLIVDFFLPLCVPFFYLSALVFFISGLKNLNLSLITIKIWQRIIIPYLIWTLIYYSLILTKHHLTDQDSSTEWWKILFYGSSAVQLYYIPRMLIMQGFVLSVLLFMNNNFKNKFIGFIIFLLSSIWLFFGIINDILGFNEFDFIIISIYLILAFIVAKLYQDRLLSYHYSILGFTLFIILILLKYVFLSYLVTTPFSSILGGLSLTLLSFSLPSIPFPNWAKLIFGFSYGIYLSHVLFLEAFEFILKYLRINLFYDFGTKLIFSICVLCSSILFVYLVKKNMELKKYLIGE